MSDLEKLHNDYIDFLAKSISEKLKDMLQKNNKVNNDDIVLTQAEWNTLHTQFSEALAQKEKQTVKDVIKKVIKESTVTRLNAGTCDEEYLIYKYSIFDYDLERILYDYGIKEL